ncbi:histidine phosphatase family protein, partial [Escherichia coli]|nr:histidine phosphatase family protein [Escherichia coli]
MSTGGVYVLAFCRSSLKSKKYFIILLALAA